MTENEPNPLQETHERIKKHYTRSDRERKDYDTRDHEMAGWWECDHCGRVFRYHPDYADTVHAVVEHMETHPSSSRE